MNELELAMDCGPDHKAFRRMNAIHLLLIGVSFEHVMRNSRIGERTLQLWISRFNDRGIDALAYRPKSGRPRKLALQEVEESILPLVDDPSLAGQSHWTAVKLHGWLRDERKLDLSYRTVVRYLHEQGYVRKMPRPVPAPPDPDSWEKSREAFAVELLALLEDPSQQVFFGDEAGFEGDPRPRQKWVKRGTRPEEPYHGGHLRRNVIGAVNPRSGQLVSLLVPYCDSTVFQVFLDTLASEAPPEPGMTHHLVLDNASWHKTGTLEWHHFKPLYLPPYSPDFNPIERLWQRLKGNDLAGYFTRNGEELEEKILGALGRLLEQPEIIRSVCNTHNK